MGLIKKILGDDDQVTNTSNVEDQFYNVPVEESLGKDGSSKMLLLEPRALSEAKQIVDYLKNRSTVIINLKRVTDKQAKRIVDYVTGAIYAIGGDIQRIGDNTFICAPKNMNVEGKITEEKEETKDNKETKEEKDIEWY